MKSSKTIRCFSCGARTPESDAVLFAARSMICRECSCAGFSADESGLFSVPDPSADDLSYREVVLSRRAAEEARRAKLAPRGVSTRFTVSRIATGKW